MNGRQEENPHRRFSFRFTEKMPVVSVTLVLTVLSLLSFTLVSASGGEGNPEGHRNWADFGWRAFNFLVLAGFFYWLLAKQVRNYLSGRQQEIKTALAEAVTAKEDAEKKFREYDAKLDKAAEDIKAMAELIRTQGLAEKERIIADARRTAEKMKEDAAKRMEQELKNARNELRAEAVCLSVQMAENILKQQISRADHNSMVVEYIDKVVTEH